MNSFFKKIMNGALFDTLSRFCIVVTVYVYFSALVFAPFVGAYFGFFK